MKILIASLIMLSLLPVAATAADSLVSRSAGKLAADETIDLSSELEKQTLLVRAPATESENYDSQEQTLQSRTYAAHSDQYFDIYEADFFLASDLDGDSYHHRLGLIFDVDVMYGNADIYAKIYLRRDGEPWTQVFTTDLFTIVDDSVADRYEVQTELVEGYAPGYYSVLIEIYSLHHASMVASAVMDYNSHGEQLRLEDQSWDEPYSYGYTETYTEVTYSHGGGSMSILPMLLGLLVIAARGRKKSLSPLSDDKKKTPALRSFT